MSLKSKRGGVKSWPVAILPDDQDKIRHMMCSNYTIEHIMTSQDVQYYPRSANQDDCSTLSPPIATPLSNRRTRVTMVLMRERKRQKSKLTNFEAERSAQLLPRRGLLDEPHGVADGLLGGIVVEVVLGKGQGDLADLVRGHHRCCFALVWSEMRAAEHARNAV